MNWGAPHTDSTISGVIANGSGTVAVTKTGTGTWTLSNTHTYTGDTTVESGKLVIAGNVTSSDIIVNADGTLAGTGTVGNVLVNGDGIFSPGNSAGTMSFVGNLTLGLDSVSDFEINAFSLGNYDLASAQTAGTQTVNFGGGILNLMFLPGFNTNGSVKIFDFDAYAGTGFSTVNVSGLASGYSASFDISNGYVTVIPEPRAAALLGILGSIAMLRRRRN